MQWRDEVEQIYAITHSPGYFLENLKYIAFPAAYEAALKELKKFDDKFIAIPILRLTNLFLITLESIFRLLRVVEIETRKINSWTVEKKFEINFRAFISAILIFSAFLRIIGTILLTVPIRLRARLLWTLLRFISVKPSELKPTKHFPAILIGLGYQVAFLFYLKDRSTISILELRKKEERKMLFQKFLSELELEKFVEFPTNVPEVLLGANIKESM